MELVNLFKRTTFHYADGWKDLDNHVYLGQLKCTPLRLVKPGNDYDNGGVYVSYARIPSELASTYGWRDIALAVKQTMSGGRCRHEYDCCGCVSTSVTVSKYGNRSLRITLRKSYNY